MMRPGGFHGRRSRTETSYIYNAAGYLAELTHRDRAGILDRYTYQYDLTGNKTAIEKQRKEGTSRIICGMAALPG